MEESSGDYPIGGNPEGLMAGDDGTDGKLIRGCPQLGGRSLSVQCLFTVHGGKERGVGRAQAVVVGGAGAFGGVG